MWIRAAGKGILSNDSLQTRFLREMEPPPPSPLPPEGKHLAAFFKSCLNLPGSLQIRAPAIIFYYVAPAASRRLYRGQPALLVQTDCERLTGLPRPSTTRERSSLPGLSRETRKTGSARAKQDPEPLLQPHDWSLRLQDERSYSGQARPGSANQRASELLG